MKAKKYWINLIVILFLGFSLCAVQACDKDDDDLGYVEDDENDEEDDDSYRKCSLCRGKGWCYMCGGDGEAASGKECSYCDGSGICHWCDGTGIAD